MKRIGCEETGLRLTITISLSPFKCEVSADDPVSEAVGVFLGGFC